VVALIAIPVAALALVEGRAVMDNRDRDRQDDLR
jgi:hypothetical protein